MVFDWAHPRFPTPTIYVGGVPSPAHRPHFFVGARLPYLSVSYLAFRASATWFLALGTPRMGAPCRMAMAMPGAGSSDHGNVHHWQRFITVQYNIDEMKN